MSAEIQVAIAPPPDSCTIWEPLCSGTYLFLTNLAIMSQLSLHLLGSFQVTRSGKAVTGFDSTKVRALLAYLFTESDRPHRRQMLANLLWPDQPERAGRHSLSQALSNLRRILGDHTADPPFLLVTRNTIGANPASDCQIDVKRFEKLVAGTPADPKACFQYIQPLQEAVALYRGEFLEGFSTEYSTAFEEWAQLERAQLARKLLNTLHQLARCHQYGGEYEQARRYAWQQIELDPLHEPAYRQLMRAYAQSGRRAAALRQYRQCARILQEELGVEPAAETTNLYEAIKERRLSPPAGSTAIVAPAADASEAMDKVEKTVFVAREGELAQLAGLLDKAIRGRGRIVFVVGETGSGKTALLQEFARQAQETVADLVVAGGHCNAYTGLGDPYLPFREILGLLTGDVESRRSSSIKREQARRLRLLLPVTGQALVEVGPDLVNTFVPGTAVVSRAVSHLQYSPQSWAAGKGGWLAQLETLAASKMAGDEGPGLEQSRLFEQYVDVLKRVAAQRPLLLLLDDLQWADDGSLSLLFHLGRNLKNTRILLVGAYRAEELAVGRDGDRHPLEPVINQFKRFFGDICIDLDNVPESESRHFVDAFVDSQPNRLGTAFREALYRQTGGHPMFVVELLRGLVARGDLVKHGDGRWIEESELDWETLPARAEGAIAERIGRLDEELQEALAVASVEGETFTAEVIAHVQAADERYIVRRLSSELRKQHYLISAQGIRRIGSRRLSVYRFRHILFQKYLYSRLDAAERAYLHEDIGNVLEMLYGEEASEIAVQLARHFEKAGNVAKAVEYLHKAGDKAMRLSAYKEAETLFTQGLELLKRLPDIPQRHQKELALQTAVGIPLSATRGFASPEVEQAFARARALCRQVGATPELFPTLWGLFYYYLVRGEDRAMNDLAEQLMEMAGSVQDPLLHPVGHWAKGVTLLYTGELEQAHAHLEEMIAFYDPQQHHSPIFRYVTDPAVACRFWSAWALWLLGYPDQALNRCYEALALAQRLSHPFSLAFALFTSAALHQFRREAQAAMGRAEATIALSQEHGFSFFLGLGTVFRGWALAEQGQIAEGMAQMRSGFAAAQATGSKIGNPHMLALLAEAHGKIGQAGEGLTLLAEALAAAHDSAERHYEAELYHLQGKLLLKLDAARQAEAEDCFYRAIEVARRQQAKSWELRTAISLSRLWQQQDKQDEARTLLAEVYNWFTEGFDTPDLQKASALLEQLDNGRF